MPFPSHLQGLNLVADSPSAYDPQPSISDDDLARTLALWTNVDFSYDDGGIGLDSAQKLLDEDANVAAGLERGQRSTRELNGASRKDLTLLDPHVAESHAHLAQLNHHQPSSSSSWNEFDFGGQHVVGGVSLSDEGIAPSDPVDPFGFNSTLYALHQQATAATATAAILPRPREDDEDTHSSSNKRRNVSRSESVSSATSPVKAEQNDEQLAPEDDKRRRNTAASARFRQKKKEREQALEKTSKELQNRCALLEREVDTLRRENGWLKTLVLGNPTIGGLSLNPSNL